MIGHSIPVYQGYASQYGHGLGNVLGGLVRSALPIVGKIAKAAGTQLLETGVNYISNEIKKRKAAPAPASVSPKRVKAEHVERTISRPRKVHKQKTPPGRPLVKRKRRRAARDIFSK